MVVGGIVPISLGLISFGVASVASIITQADTCFEPPPSEPIEVIQLPLPPVVPTDESGACTHHLNPHGTGCMGKSSLMNGGDFSPDGNHVLVSLNFTGAPSAPDPASIYTGVQLILIRTNGTNFSTGSPWKCLTCGVPESHRRGSSSLADYPQVFADGQRALAGNNIVECRAGLLASEACTPDQIHIYPIRLSNTADDSGSGAIIRELRLHPDNVHLGFNSFSVTASGQLSQHTYFGRLQFNDSPATGSPRTTRYDLVNVTVLVAPDGPLPYTVTGDQMQINRQALVVGEFRGFANRGQEVLYIGVPWESCNIDLFAADLTTGEVRRVTTHPGYVDPVGVSPDGRWQVILDTRGTDRMEFLSAMRGVPPVVDLLTVTTVASVRNNGDRRFFQPWLLDAHGDRDGPDYNYYGQQINAGGDGQPGSINDPNWNAGADPRWSPDGTRIMYWQKMVVPPACGGINPLPCPTSTEPGGRTSRLMMARLTSRQPYHLDPVAPVSDRVPWGLPYISGESVPEVFNLPPGNYTLHGQVSGSADVVLRNTKTASALDFVAVRYHNYSDDGVHYIQGHESVASTFLSVTSARLDWYSNLTATGASYSTKVTGPGGFHVVDDAMLNVFVANGTLVTTVDGVVYKQPLTGT
ncbi:saponin hydrolase precursor [Aspergillus violaceofuscus CBS 115571]|uniref:Saponin hydrolase n=1 Tax=Aspergillus violaceofuscus (strain CBS 115571) TaxID=1450538 RepID=A0A2V5GYR9_ASPV1|nr:saponin hydrolase precursor [Aspergillus violaceofuscus CBS 115571]